MLSLNLINYYRQNMDQLNLKEKATAILAVMKNDFSKIAKNKKLMTGVIAAAGIILIAGIGWHFFEPKAQNQSKKDEQIANKLSPRNCQYIVENQVITLVDGKEETVSPYGAETQTTEIYGDPVTGDLNSDGQDDYAVIITQKTANDVGVYYYAAVALADEKTGVIAGTIAVPLGDRIVIKDTAIVNQAFRVNYLDWRTNGDAVEESPTNPITKSFILDGIMLKELTEKRANAQPEAACTDNSGTWSAGTNECKGLSKEWCEKNAGTFENDTCKF